MRTLRYLIATPSHGECEVLAGQDDETLLPLASVFELYLLGALVEAVGAGGITWDDPVTIGDELVSLGGPTAEEEPGTTLPVRELATTMIWDSDNTATDHLMDLVGPGPSWASKGGRGTASQRPPGGCRPATGRPTSRSSAW
ncbi:MAG: class A beta-lactamase-related serine hydrolase [Acidimicrobiia bacterium]|nr:class A beta-lactamase-related serine hydrolase [Acidimicrobiia bacterium]